MKYKKMAGIVAILVSALLIFAACSSDLDDNSKSSKKKDSNTGSVTIRFLNSGEGAKSTNSGARYIGTDSMNSVKVTVAGYGMDSMTSKAVSTTNGEASVTINNIPIGLNRVIKVQGYKGNDIVRGAVLYGVLDIKKGENSVSVSSETSKKGAVYYALIAKAISDDTLKTFKSDYSDYSDKTGDDLIEAFLSTTDEYIPDVDASLIDIDTIVDDKKSGDIKLMKKEDYIMKASDVSFELSSHLDKDTYIAIGDPNSARYKASGTEDKITIKDVAPGEWNVFKVVGETTSLMGSVTVGKKGAEVTQSTHGIELTKAGEEVKDDPVPDDDQGSDEGDSGGGGDSTPVTPGTDDSQELHGSDDGGSDTPAVTDKIIIHAKNYQYIWYWKTGAAGAEKKLDADSATGANWYKITFSDPSAVNMIILKTATGWTGSQTPDTAIPKAGEYWYDTSLKTSNPEDSVKPTISAFTADKTGTVSGVVTFKLSASDNAGLAEAQIKDGSNVIVSVKLSGKSIKDGAIKWDTTKIKNGSHSITCVVIDAAKNESTAKGPISITTNNELPAPVVVITGGTSCIIGKDIKFTGSGTNDALADSVTYKWEVGSGASIKSGGTAASCVITAGGSAKDSVTVTLTVTYNGTKSAKGTKTFKIREQGSVPDDWDFRDETIYFLMTTRFYDGDPSNNEYCWDEGGDYLKIKDGDPAWRGDFKGLADKLDYIKDLGFTAVWITPVVENASGIDYHGYHAYDFSKVDPRYESHDAAGNVTFGYQDLIDACHAAGIKVVQDIVLNHSGNWGENNLFHMFKKAANTTPKDKTTGGKMSRLMEVDDKEGYIAKSMGSVDAYNNAVGGVQYEKGRIGAMKTDSIDTKRIYHHSGSLSWNGYSVQTGQIAGDCVDLNTENPDVMKYLIDCYKSYIDMGVDAFRVDTVKHISRWTLNQTFNKEIIEHAGDKFFMFGEVCARYRGRVNEGCWGITPSYYTWTEDGDPAWGDTASNEKNAEGDWAKNNDGWGSKIPNLGNGLLKNGAYHAPDYSHRSHMDVIDFYMHWAFNDAGDAFHTGVSYDNDYCDPTWNVTYVDSHDYAPDNAPESKRFNGYWNDKLNLLFTFRGIPCIYYGSEIEFKKGLCIDPPAERTYLSESGRAYYGDEIAGASSHALYKQIKALNAIRAACPALRKGQYSTDGCSGAIAFKRCYKDSWVAVAINGQATFSGLPSGTWVDATTGDSKSGSGFTTRAVGTGDAAIYILGGTGKIASGGTLGH